MSFRLTPRNNGDIDELLNWLSQCPSRHRHLLNCLGEQGFDLYMSLSKLEAAAKTLGTEVEVAAKPFGFVRHR